MDNIGQFSPNSPPLSGRGRGRGRGRATPREARPGIKTASVQPPLQVGGARAG